MACSNNNLAFNQKPATILHLDLNSCFATIEQQANPLLRGKPVAVAAYLTPSGCIIAPSIEAKKKGIRVGMRVKDGRLIEPNLIILTPDPWKYRCVHLQLRQIISRYTNDFWPKSIDEFALNLEGYPAFAKGMKTVGREIKQAVKKEIGEWVTISVGIAPNFFLAKLAAGLKKPDGLEEINAGNHQAVYRKLRLEDLPGIKAANTARLNSAGIFTVSQFAQATAKKLQAAFHSVAGYYWHLRLRGWEIDDVQFGRKSFGAMYALPQPLVTKAQLAPILTKLVEKAAWRMRQDGYQARGIHLAIVYRDHSFWHRGEKQNDYLFDSRDLYKAAYRLLGRSPYSKPVANLAVSCFELLKTNGLQLDLLGEASRKASLCQALDRIKEKYGDWAITPAMMLGSDQAVADRIGFGNIKDLERFISADV